MKVTEHINKAKGETQFTLEILPPLKGQSIHDLYAVLDELSEFNPPFVDVTYHREEFEYKPVGNGLLQQRTIRKRPGTVGICAAIQNKYKIDAIPHILCGGFSKEDTENLLIDLDFLEIDNVVALRGDAVKNETYFTPHQYGHSYASELVAQIAAMNRGEYLDKELQQPHATNFCIGVSGYPEKHMEAPSLESDFHFLKEKIKSGAEYVVTQMFFDNKKYFEFVRKLRNAGIKVPVIPGLKPLSTLKQLNTIPHRFHVDLPEELIKAVIKCKNNTEVKLVGIEWCIQQSKELKAAGVPFLHYYSMSKSDNIKAVASQVF
ncbi:MAG: methylenetetrahydrofolate reductase [NAD(P)H] [Flavobacteriaceae bacterium]|jgi:methylenetetrahydrofolate reductase (NADPH)